MGDWRGWMRPSAYEATVRAADRSYAGVWLVTALLSSMALWGSSWAAEGNQALSWLWGAWAAIGNPLIWLGWMMAKDRGRG